MTLASSSLEGILKLYPRQWFAWHQLGLGEFAEPWRAQLMLVNTLEPLRTGLHKLKLNVTMLPRPHQARTMDAVVTFQKQSDHELIGTWEAAGDPKVVVAIKPVDQPWLGRHAPWALQTRLGLQTAYEAVTTREILEGGLGTDPAAVCEGAAADMRHRDLPSVPQTMGRTPCAIRFAGIEAFLVLRGVSVPRHETKWNIYRDCQAVVVRRASNNEVYWIADFVEREPAGSIEITHLAVNLAAVRLPPEDAVAEFERVIRSAILLEDVDWPTSDVTEPEIRDAWAALDVSAGNTK